jgi:arginase
MARDFTLLEVPYHMGLAGVGVGAGPGRLLAAGLDQLLGRRGMPAQVQHIGLRDKSCEGMDAVVDLSRQIRVAVRQAAAEQVVPVVAAGNCNTCVGTLAGLDPWGLGIVWLDRHPDFHTPATSISGSLEGMSLAVVVGDCHEELRARIGFGEPVATERVWLPVCRDIEPGERERVQAAGFATDAAEFAGRVEAVYLHIDTDFFGGPGPGIDEAEALVRSVMAELPVVSVGLTNFDPVVSPGRLDEVLRLAAALR